MPKEFFAADFAPKPPIYSSAYWHKCSALAAILFKQHFPEQKLSIKFGIVIFLYVYRFET